MIIVNNIFNRHVLTIFSGHMLASGSKNKSLDCPFPNRINAEIIVPVLVYFKPSFAFPPLQHQLLHDIEKAIASPDRVLIPNCRV